MKNPILTLVLAVGLASFAENTFAAATNTPISLSGWNQDVVLSSSGNYSSQVTTNIAGFALYANGVTKTNNQPATVGLPANGIITGSANLYNTNTTFRFQSYTGPNVLVNSGTLTLNSPAAFMNLAFLNFVQGAPQTFSITLNFQDATSIILGSVSHQDWVNKEATTAFTTGIYYPGGNNFIDIEYVNYNENDFQIPVDYQNKIVNSITINNSGPHTSYVFAVSGSAVPEPSTYALFGIGAIGMLMVLRRKKTA
jgi:hypothetical protein